MISADNWPTHSEELARKATEQLEKWANSYDAGKITRREFYIAVSILYDTTSGLVPKALSNQLADIHEGIRRGG